jgi:hypothetical protein
MKTKANKQNHTSVLNVNENISPEEQIAQRAHDLWQERGREHGGDLADWLRAEREVNEWHQKRLAAANQVGNETTGRGPGLSLNIT